MNKRSINQPTNKKLLRKNINRRAANDETNWPIVQQKVVPVLLDAGALGGEMSVADDYNAESALKVAPSPLARKTTSATCW